MLNAILFLILAILIGSFGSLFLKKGAVKFSLNPLKAVKNWRILLGICLFGVSLLFYIGALRYANLSVIYPMSSFSYVMITLLSRVFLKEKISSLKLVGISFIILGAFLVVS